MATVFAVHGTFAHDKGTSEVGSGEASVGKSADKAWWEKGSEFERDLVELVSSDDGTLEFEPVIWDGANSEKSRRQAGRDLYKQVHQLEGEEKNYVMVGHSHGGSVVSSALLAATAKRKPLAKLKNWITVGTPFISLRKERFLFSRVPLVMQAIYVSLLLFVVMFLLPMLLGVFASDDTRVRYMGGVGFVDTGSIDGIAMLGISTLILSSLFILFYIFLVVMDRRILHMHSPGVIKRATKNFSSKWLALTHEDDEAVQGLRSLNKANFNIFNSSFFVPLFTTLAVFALPVAYIVLIFSPSAMIAITDYLKTNMYHYEAASPVVAEAKQLRDDVRALRREMRGTGLTMRSCLSGPVDSKPSAQITVEQANQICGRWKSAQKKYRELRSEQPALPRTLRFEAAFIDEETGQLQGGGHDTRVNSWMLFNLISDGVSRIFRIGGRAKPQEVRLTRSERQKRRVLRQIVPAFVVPLLFAISAVVVLFLVRSVARFISGFIARALDGITWRQIRRSALGNDTTSEIANNASESPHWLTDSFAYLPADLASKLSDHSNKIATQSLGKFRNAISDLAFADAKEGDADIVSEYFTWKELVHSSYFDVAEFRKLVAYSIAQSDGFSPTPKFKSDPDYDRVAGWYKELQGGRKSAGGNNTNDGAGGSGGAGGGSDQAPNAAAGAAANAAAAAAGIGR
ncbi:MAG: hypothetical protein ACRBCJ_01625 [Hyphomicrobiaceae bacterium]